MKLLVSFIAMVLVMSCLPSTYAINQDPHKPKSQKESDTKSYDSNHPHVYINGFGSYFYYDYEP